MDRQGVRPSPLAASWRAVSTSSAMRVCSMASRRERSAGLNANENWLGTRVPRTPSVRRMSISRTRRRPNSTGCSPLRNALANAPSTRRSRRCSNFWSPMVSRSVPRAPSTLVARGAGRLPCPPCCSGEWRNRQTRWLQVPVTERSWGFKSPLAHRRGLSTQPAAHVDITPGQMARVGLGRPAWASARPPEVRHRQGSCAGAALAFGAWAPTSF